MNLLMPQSRGVFAGSLLNVITDNLFIRSNDFARYTTESSWAGWMPHGTTIASTNNTDPLGTATASRQNIAAHADNNHYCYQIVPNVSAQAYCFSIHVKAGATTPWDYVGLRVSDGIAYNKFAVFQISTGTFVFNDTGVTYGVTALANGWFRIYMSWTFATALKTPNFGAEPTTAAGAITHTGNDGKGFLIWGAQVHAGTTPLAYTATLRKPSPEPVLTPTALVTVPQGYTGGVINLSTFRCYNNRASAVNVQINNNPQQTGSSPKISGGSLGAYASIAAGASALVDFQAGIANISGLAQGQYEIYTSMTSGQWFNTSPSQIIAMASPLVFRVNFDILAPGTPVSSIPSPFVWGHDIIT